MGKPFNREKVIERAIGKANDNQLVFLNTIVAEHEKASGLSVAAANRMRGKIKEKGEKPNVGNDKV